MNNIKKYNLFNLNGTCKPCIQTVLILKYYTNVLSVKMVTVRLACELAERQDGLHVGHACLFIGMSCRVTDGASVVVHYEHYTE